MTDGDVNLALAYPPHKHSWTICECGATKSQARDDRGRAWAALYDSGLTVDEVAAQTEFSYFTVYHAIREWTTLRQGRPRGSSRRPSRAPRPDRIAEFETWKAAYETDETTSIPKLATQFGVSVSTIHRGLLRVETKMRTGSSIDVVRDEEARRLVVDEGLTLEQAGQRLGITRERVRQIVVKRFGIIPGPLRKARAAARMEAERNKPSICSFCGAEYKRGHKEWTEHYRSAHPHAKIKPENAEKYLAMVADYDAGLKQREIMAKWNCRPTLVYRALAYVGREHSRRNSSRLPSRAASLARKKAIIADLKTKTMFSREIAEKHGVSDALVRMIGKEHGVGMSISEAMKMRHARAKAS